MPDIAALGRAVRALREARGISQVQLAANGGFTQSWVSQIERGRRNPNWNNLVRLAAGLRVPVAKLASCAEAETRIGDTGES